MQSGSASRADGPSDAFRRARDFLLAHRGEPDVARRDFRWPRPDRFNWALDHFDRLAEEAPERTALWLVDEETGDLRLSFGALRERSDRVAAGLEGLGVARGDVVLVMLRNVAALWETLLACFKLGAPVIPATPQLMAEDVADRLERGGVDHLVVDAREAVRLAGVAGERTRVAVEAEAAGGARVPGGETPGGWTSYRALLEHGAPFRRGDPTPSDHPLLLYFTSGTTARPKLVTHTHLSYPVGHLSTMYWLGLRPGDLHWNISSPGWAKHAWSSLFAPWNAGATALARRADRFEARDALRILVRCRVDSLCAPPTVWRLLIQEELEAHPVRLREAVSAGEPLNAEIVRRVREAWGVTVRDGYGQTETTAQIGNPPGEPVRPGSMGRPLPGFRVVLLDPGGRPADEGEICLELDPPPVGLMAGYRGDPARTAGVMEGGRYHTRDVASRDAEGYLHYVGRTDDVFKSSDYRVSPFELESVLLEHEAVAEAAVVPSPHPLRLSVPKAFVQTAHGHDPDAGTARDLLAFCRRRLAPYRRVRRLEFAELPKTISGKIRRVELRRREEAREELSDPDVDPARVPRRPGEFWEEDFPELRSDEGA